MTIFPNTDRRSYFNPAVEPVRGIASRQRQAYTAVGRGIGRNTRETMDEDVARNLNAPGHRRIVKSSRIVHFELKRPGCKSARWR